MSLVFESHSLRDTDRLAAEFVNHIPAGTTVALSGTLGSGKTRFVQGVGTAMGIDSDKITSPTFVLCNEHELTCSMPPSVRQFPQFVYLLLPA